MLLGFLLLDFFCVPPFLLHKSQPQWNHNFFTTDKGREKRGIAILPVDQPKARQKGNNRRFKYWYLERDREEW